MTPGQDRVAPPVTPESGEGAPGLYVHIPFCRTKCGYCSFTSYPCRHEPPAGYLTAVNAEARRMAAQPWPLARQFTTLFIGGGTPTIYGGSDLAELIGELRSLFAFAAHPEITVECNPNTISRETLTALKAAGVNRLSIGVQAFSDRLLNAIGRSHTRAEALAAIRLAREAGFDNLNLDLIFGLPGQAIADLRESLADALAFRPEHLALYELMIEEQTPFARLAAAGKLRLPDDEAMADMDILAQEMLASHGLIRYEISNYARPGRECVHNLNYWRNGSYLGLGAAAVSSLNGLRLRNVAAPERYMALVHNGKAPYAEAEALGCAARFRETVIMGLRLPGGVAIPELAARFGLTPRDYYGTTVEKLVAQGMLAFADNRMRLTPHGLPVANQVLAQLV